jgi:signal transduction histidine kinase
MRSIGARLALWYALAATVTFAGLSVAGYFLLEEHLIHGLDLLNASELKQIQARLGPNHHRLNAREVDERIRESTDYASTLFYIDIHTPQETLFQSTNLRGQPIPDVKGLREFNVVVPEIGELRVGEFILDPLDVMIATPTRPVRVVMEGYVEVCAALVAVMLAVSAAIGFGLSWLALRPVRVIQETANRIGSRNLSERIPVSNVRDEVSNLARLLNQMFDRLESSFDQVRRFTADASHELKTPLSIMRLQAEKMIVDGTLSSGHEEIVESQLEEIARLNAIIEELLFLSRAEAQAISMDRNAHNPTGFLLSFAQDARVLAEHNSVRFRDTHEGEGVAVFDPKWLRQVLLNLLTNALKASPVGGTISLRSVLSGWIWRVSLEEEGPGVPDTMRSQIFDRFVRLEPATERQAGGTGLGLAICRGIIELHRGRIFAEAGADGRGLRVVFELPAQGSHLPGEFRSD